MNNNESLMFGQNYGLYFDFFWNLFTNLKKIKNKKTKLKFDFL